MPRWCAARTYTNLAGDGASLGRGLWGASLGARIYTDRASDEGSAWGGSCVTKAWRCPAFGEGFDMPSCDEDFQALRVHRWLNVRRA